jgi:hypothetical protein
VDTPLASRIHPTGLPARARTTAAPKTGTATNPETVTAYSTVSGVGPTPKASATVTAEASTANRTQPDVTARTPAPRSITG